MGHKPFTSQQSKACKASGLDALLRRKDVWLGASQLFVSEQGIDTGFEDLNKLLVQRGWPQGCLIEVLQAHYAATWLLMGSAVKHIVKAQGGLLVLINPPVEPYTPSLLQMQLPVEKLLIVNAPSKADFIACFIELARSQACAMLMAWQPAQSLHYAELRKCQLATHEQPGLNCLFRPDIQRGHASPASLRISTHITARYLELKLEKQRGRLAGDVLALPLPDDWFSEPDYADLYTDSGEYRTTPWLGEDRAATILPWQQRK